MKRMMIFAFVATIYATNVNANGGNDLLVQQYPRFTECLNVHLEHYEAKNKGNKVGGFRYRVIARDCAAEYMPMVSILEASDFSVVYYRNHYQEYLDQ